jgi:hypothetical protein
MALAPTVLLTIRLEPGVPACSAPQPVLDTIWRTAMNHAYFWRTALNHTC